MFRTYFRKSILLFALASASALADSPDVYLVRGLPDEPDLLKVMLADSAEPIWVEAKELITLSSLIDHTCGTLSASIKNKFLATAKRMNGFKDDESEVIPGLVVAIPFCTVINKEQKVIVNKGDTLSDILQKNTGIYGQKSVRQLVSEMKDLPPHQLTNIQIEHFAKEIKPGDEILLPYTSEKRLYIPKAGAEQPQALLALNMPSGYESGVELNLAVKTTIENISFNPTTNLHSHLQYNSEIDSIKPVALESVKGGDSCNVTGENEPFSQAKFDLILQQQLSRISSKGEAPSKTRVGVIDSGLGGYEGEFFKKTFFSINKRESSSFSKQNVDDDDNGFVDDILGINFENEHHRIHPFIWNDSRKRAHGTQVASLTLGGVNYRRETTQENYVEMVIVNFGRHGGGLQSAANLLTAIDYLDKRDVKIINLSLSTSLALQVIENKRDILFIAAAGNESQDVRTETRYPAIFGGHYNSQNVVTVGSYADGKRKASFSNYGDNVDLYAPGCNLKVVSDDETITYEHGTSMSAGIVTFVSAVIDALVPGGMSSTQIKERLFRSADYMMPFTEWKHGNLMNPYKAISVYQDILEIRGQNEDTIMIFGILNDKEQLRQVCKDPIKRPRLNGIVKMTPNIRRGNENVVRYLIEEPGGRQFDMECSQEKNFILNGFIGDDDELKKTSIENVVDIVIASF